jgi:hypothetical protein
VPLDVADRQFTLQLHRPKFVEKGGARVNQTFVLLLLACRVRPARRTPMAQEGSAMHRIFGLLALAAAGLGLWVLFGPIDPDRLGNATLAVAPAGYGGWALGLLMGLALALLASVDWRDFPVRFGQWLRLQRRRLGLIVLGGLCAGVLLLF